MCTREENDIIKERGLDMETEVPPQRILVDPISSLLSHNQMSTEMYYFTCQRDDVSKRPCGVSCHHFLLGESPTRKTNLSP